MNNFLGIFALSVEFHTKYPVMPPEIRFLTPVYSNNHLNTIITVCIDLSLQH